MPTGSDPHPPTRPGAEPFRCEISHERDNVRIAPIGELDVATVPIFGAEIEALRNAGCRRLIFDLRRLEFMDSTGLRCILELDAEALRDGFSIAVIPGSRAVQRVFELTRTGPHLPFIDP